MPFYHSTNLSRKGCLIGYSFNPYCIVHLYLWN
jgi:hypothetical protein